MWGPSRGTLPAMKISFTSLLVATKASVQEKEKNSKNKNKILYIVTYPYTITQTRAESSVLSLISVDIYTAFRSLDVA